MTLGSGADPSGSQGRSAAAEYVACDVADGLHAVRSQILCALDDCWGSGGVVTPWKIHMDPEKKWRFGMFGRSFSNFKLVMFRFHVDFHGCYLVFWCFGEAGPFRFCVIL